MVWDMQPTHALYAKSVPSENKGIGGLKGSSEDVYIPIHIFVGPTLILGTRHKFGDEHTCTHPCIDSTFKA